MNLEPCTPEPEATLGRGPNPPGRAALAYRLGDRHLFLTTMLQDLGAQPGLASLTTRASDEPVVALLDAWATALDVVAFYSERIANEGFLVTATQRDSVLLLARAIGYELRPGVAATTWLAFTVTASPGAPDRCPLLAGTKAQSVPGPGELPQVFEIVEAVEARPLWNAMPVRAAAGRLPAAGDAVLRLARTDLALQPGDPLLVLAGGAPGWFDVRRVRSAEIVEAVLADPLDPERPLLPAHTVVTLDDEVTERPFATGVPSGAVEVHVLRERASVFGHNAVEYDALPLVHRVGELNPFLDVETTTVTRRAMSPIDRLGISLPEPAMYHGVFAGRRSSWTDAVFTAGTNVVHLDQTYPRVTAGSWVVFERDGAVTARIASAVTETPHTDFGLAARVTRLTLDGDVPGYSPRNATVLLRSERLDFAPWPLAEELADTDLLELAHRGSAPGPGRTIIVSGTSPEGEPLAEVATVAARLTALAGGGPRLRLTARLQGSYRRDTVRVLGNVAKATHGESRAEILGSGDHRVAFQSFRLKQAPLTHVRSVTPTGARSTLAVWVGGVRWQEVEALHGAGPEDRVFVTRRADDGTVSVTFGDGVTGARLPSGRDNIAATYRVGVGRAGNLPTARLTIPLTRPLGLSGVTNPVPATGADDPEPLDRARTDAPLTVRTLGRIVSVADHADFARAYAGIGKARADVLWDGRRQVIHLTVAGPDGAGIEAGAATARDLATAIDVARHAVTPVAISGHVARRLVVEGRLVVAADRRFPDVADAARAALVSTFSFRRRDFAQPVTESEVMACLHGVRGVVAVLLDQLRATDDPPGRLAVVDARPARRLGTTTHPAELLTLLPADVDLQEATP